VQRPEQQREGKRSGVAPLTALIASFAIVLQAAQWRAAAEAAPSAPERIAATLVRWGVAVEGVAPPVDPEARARHEQLLSSDIGEERVRAARWLAARGVRSAGARIVDAMNDPGTMRPCQLAHSLGSLGDERWVDQLIAGARQRRNTDLRVCSVIAMRKLGSVATVDALLELTLDPSLRTPAIVALGEIGDAAALPRLRAIAQVGEGSSQALVAERAIGQIELLTLDDPVPALLRRMESSIRDGAIDDWAARHLARRADRRAVGPLANAVGVRRLPEKDREIAAAALLALGAPGERALVHLADSGDGASSIAAAALSLLENGAHADGRRSSVGARRRATFSPRAVSCTVLRRDHPPTSVAGRERRS